MAKRGRKKKIRYIHEMPPVSQFSPRGKPGRPDEMELKIDEFEALKLADAKGYSQLESAEQMGISRASFGRILRSARKTVAIALTEGRIIRIRTSDVQVGLTRKHIPNKEDRDLEIHSELEQVARDSILKHKI